MSNRYDDLRREEYPLRSHRTSDVVAAVQQALAMGDVYKIVVESGRPLLVYRKKEQSDGLLHEEDSGLDGIMRNAEVVEYYNSLNNGFETVVDMMQLVEQEGCFPVCWATGQRRDSLLEQWFKFKERGLRTPPLDHLLGLPIVRLQTLPEETLIICAAEVKDAEISDVVFCIKTSMEVRNASLQPSESVPSFERSLSGDTKEVQVERQAEPGGEADHQIGGDPEGDAAPTRTLEDGPRGDNDVGSWFPPSFSGIRMVNG